MVQIDDIRNKKRKLIEFLLENKILLSPELLEKIESLQDPSQISDLINSQMFAEASKKQLLQETELKINAKLSPINILFSFDKSPRKITAQDFITHFNSRYNSLKKILQQRAQLSDVLSIDKLNKKNERDSVSIIGCVFSKEDTKNGCMLVLDDPTGSIKVYVGKNKQELWDKARDVVHDEIIGITGSLGKNIIFANDIFFPDIPATKELKKSPEEEYLVVASDIHVGSSMFLEDEFFRFIKWIRGEEGDEKQKELASKVKYLFITGDVVDGISIYPTQQDELVIMTFKDQYKRVVELLKLIPKDIQIILSPGNHDVVAIAEPQPPIPKEYSEELWQMPNVTLVSNPAMVNIGAKEGFVGFDVLLYHGYSYNYYADKVESIRAQKPNISERADLVMKLLLQKRHLAPTYDANPHLPTEKDFMVIDKVPDIFISGDVHKSAAFTYKNVITGIVSSCFQSTTPFQEKVGHTPDPGRIPILNLKTREVKILNFSEEKEELEKIKDG